MDTTWIPRGIPPERAHEDEPLRLPLERLHGAKLSNAPRCRRIAMAWSTPRRGPCSGLREMDGRISAPHLRVPVRLETAAERECWAAWAHARVEAKVAEYRGAGKIPRGIRNAETGRFGHACPDLDQEPRGAGLRAPDPEDVRACADDCAHPSHRHGEIEC